MGKHINKKEAARLAAIAPGEQYQEHQPEEVLTPEEWEAKYGSFTDQDVEVALATPAQELTIESESAAADLIVEAVEKYKEDEDIPVSCADCGSGYMPLKAKVQEWAATGKDWDPGAWVCPSCVETRELIALEEADAAAAKEVKQEAAPKPKEEVKMTLEERIKRYAELNMRKWLLVRYTDLKGNNSERGVFAIGSTPRYLLCFTWHKNEYGVTYYCFTKLLWTGLTYVLYMPGIGTPEPQVMVKQDDKNAALKGTFVIPTTDETARTGKPCFVASTEKYVGNGWAQYNQ